LTASLNKAPGKGGNEEQREKTQVLTKKRKTQSESQRGKGANYVSELASVVRSISEKEREEKPEKQ
jgi:hypothetical protein